MGLALIQFETAGHLQVRALEQTRDPREQIASSKAAARAIGEFEGLTWCAGKHGVQKADREAILGARRWLLLRNYPSKRQL